MLLLIVLFPIFAWAASEPPAPPAGVTERQIQEEYEAKQIDAKKEIPLLEEDIPERRLDTGSATALVREVVFSGNTIFSFKELAKVVRPYMNRELSMAQMEEMCQAIQKKYARKGYFLARAYLPEQDLQEGKLKVVVIEGKLGDVTVIGNKHYSTEFIQSYFKKLQDKTINYDAVLKALLLLDENSDLKVGAVFKKGKEFGTADIVVRVQDQKPMHLVIDHNDFGSSLTSLTRTGGRFDCGNIITDGDMLTAVEVVGAPMDHLNFTNLIYHIPMNTYGSAWDASYLIANFKSPREDGVKFTGRSHIGTLKFGQALQRTRRLNTDLFAAFDYKQVKNYGNGILSSFDKLRVITGGASLDYIDGWKGRNIFNLSASWGIPNILGGLKAIDSRCSREDAGGRFVHLNGGIKRLQRLPYDCLLLLSGVAQYSFDKLPLPEQIYIGGMDTVRGYKLAEALGDHGFYANIELRVPPPFLRDKRLPWSKKKRWGEFLHFVGFLDHGQTFVYGHDILREIVLSMAGHSELEGVQQLGRAVLTSAGTGLRIYGPWKFEGSFDVAWPITSQHRSSNTILYYRIAWNIL
jgi:hemolysin activation/secretion protein